MDNVQTKEKQIGRHAWVKTAEVGDRVVIVGHGDYRSMPAIYLGSLKTQSIDESKTIVMAGAQGYSIVGGDPNYARNMRRAQRKIYRFYKRSLHEVQPDTHSYIHYYTLEEWDDLWADYFIRQKLILELQSKVRSIEVKCSPLTTQQLLDILDMVGDVYEQIRPRSPNDQKYSPDEIVLNESEITILKVIHRLQPDVSASQIWAAEEIKALNKFKAIRNLYFKIARCTKYGYASITQKDRWMPDCRHGPPINHPSHYYNLNPVGYDILGLPRPEHTLNRG